MPGSKTALELREPAEAFALLADNGQRQVQAVHQQGCEGYAGQLVAGNRVAAGDGV